MTFRQEMKKALLTSAWFVFLTFPILVIRVNTIENVIEWRWLNMMWIAAGSFILSLLWSFYFGRKTGDPGKKTEAFAPADKAGSLFRNPRFRMPALVLTALFATAFPFLFSVYQTSIMTTALMYVVLGLGLNIIVGLAGLLNLGYVAFYAVGAYSYALLHYHFGLGFWVVLPLGGLLATLFAILLGFPVLRLRGDYLAIVTLGFGEIVRLILENWNEFSFGPSGISNIPRPGLLGLDLNLDTATIYLYYLMIGLCLITIFVFGRIRDSRIGRALIALREDEIACQAMGIDKARTKLLAFALGSTWAGLMGVIFAAKTTFVNPASFTFLESAMILSIVVLGGMGSILGVVLGAFLLILLPEYLRAFSDYRMLLFGTTMVIMMIFRPQGIITGIRRTYQFRGGSIDGATAGK
ncbi:MAG: branched-chain amino acid ABC transporter permease [Deltaproteobacteria bacterium]|nr:branched-chain amino acid ABC transporter permease [Deltaproteobacteria bacterium]